MLRKHAWQRENEFGSALWMLQHRKESDRLRLVAFFVTGARVRTRKGAELSKRVSVCQRSAQGAKRRSGRLRSRPNP